MHFQIQEPAAIANETIIPTYIWAIAITWLKEWGSLSLFLSLSHWVLLCVSVAQFKITRFDFQWTWVFKEKKDNRCVQGMSYILRLPIKESRQYYTSFRLSLISTSVYVVMLYDRKRLHKTSIQDMFEQCYNISVSLKVYNFEELTFH